MGSLVCFQHHSTTQSVCMNASAKREATTVTTEDLVARGSEQFHSINPLAVKPLDVDEISTWVVCWHIECLVMLMCVYSSVLIACLLWAGRGMCQLSARKTTAFRALLWSVGFA